MMRKEGDSLGNDGAKLSNHSSESQSVGGKRKLSDDKENGGDVDEREKRERIGTDEDSTSVSSTTSVSSGNGRQTNHISHPFAGQKSTAVLQQSPSNVSSSTSADGDEDEDPASEMNSLPLLNLANSTVPQRQLQALMGSEVQRIPVETEEQLSLTSAAIEAAVTREGGSIDAFSGLYIVTCSNLGVVRVYHQKSARMLIDFKCKGTIDGIYLDTAKSRLACVHYNNEARHYVADIWNMLTNTMVKSTIVGFESGSPVVFNNSGTRLVTCSNKSNMLSIFDTTTGQMLLNKEVFWYYSSYSLCFSADDSRILVGLDYGSVKVYNMTNGEEILTLSPSHGSIHIKRIAVSHDQGSFNGQPRSPQQVQAQQSLCVVAGNNSIVAWNFMTGKQIAYIPTERMDLSGLCFGPNNSCVIQSSYRGGVVVWNLVPAQRLYVLIPTIPVSQIAFNPLNHTIAAVYSDSDKVVHVYDAMTGMKVVETRNLMTKINSLHCSPLLCAPEIFSALLSSQQLPSSLSSSPHSVVFTTARSIEDNHALPPAASMTLNSRYPTQGSYYISHK
jgi:hypothetical protein